MSRSSVDPAGVDAKSKRRAASTSNQQEHPDFSIVSVDVVTSRQRLCSGRRQKSNDIVSDWLLRQSDRAILQTAEGGARSSRRGAQRTSGTHAGVRASASSLPPVQQEVPRRQAGGSASAAAGTGLPVATTASGQPLLLHGQPLYLSTGRIPYLQTSPSGGALLAADGSVLQLGPSKHALPPLARLPPPEVPYLVNSRGAPYGMCHDGTLLPLAVSARGELWCGPDGHPLLLKPWDPTDTQQLPDHHQQQQQDDEQLYDADEGKVLRALVTAAGSPVWLSSGAAAGAVVAWNPVRGAAAPAVVTAVAVLSSGQRCLNERGRPLRVDPASLELLGSKGQPVFDQQGQPLRLQGMRSEAAAAAAEASGGAVQWLRARFAAACLAAVLVVLVVGVLMQVALSLGVTPLSLVGCLLALVLLGGAGALVAHRPAAPMMKHPVLLDIHGKPLCDARGQRLCLTPADVTGHQRIVTDTGDPVCVGLERGGRRAQLFTSVDFIRSSGGSGVDFLVDHNGDKWLGRQGAPLRVLFGDANQPRVSPLGLPLALGLSGVPYTGPDGRPLYTTPSGTMLLSQAGHPLLGPRGQLLALGLHGELLQVDGAPLRGPSRRRLYLGAYGLQYKSSSSASARHSAVDVSLHYAPVPALFSRDGSVLMDDSNHPVAAAPLMGGLFTYYTTTSSSSSSSAPSSLWWWWVSCYQPGSANSSRSRRLSSTLQQQQQKGAAAAGVSASRQAKLRRQVQLSAALRRAGGGSSNPVSQQNLSASGSFSGSLAPLRSGALYSRGHLGRGGAGAAGRRSQACAGISERSLVSDSQQNLVDDESTQQLMAEPEVCYIPFNARGVSLTKSSSSQSLATGTTSAAGSPLPTPPHGNLAAATAAAVAASGSIADSGRSSSNINNVCAAHAAAQQGAAAGRSSWWVLDAVLLTVQFMLLTHWGSFLVGELSWGVVAAAAGIMAPGWAAAQRWWRAAASYVDQGLTSTARNRNAGQLVAAAKGCAAALAAVLLVACWLTVQHPHNAGAAPGTGQARASASISELQQLAAAAASGSLGRQLSAEECMQLEDVAAAAATRLPWHTASAARLVLPAECQTSMAYAAVLHVFGALLPSGVRATPAAVVTHWLLASWPVPHAALAAAAVVCLLAAVVLEHVAATVPPPVVEAAAQQPTLQQLMQEQREQQREQQQQQARLRRVKSMDVNASSWQHWQSDMALERAHSVHSTHSMRSSSKRGHSSSSRRSQPRNAHQPLPQLKQQQQQPRYGGAWCALLVLLLVALTSMASISIALGDASGVAVQQERLLSYMSVQRAAKLAAYLQALQQSATAPSAPPLTYSVPPPQPSAAVMGDATAQHVSSPHMPPMPTAAAAAAVHHIPTPPMDPEPQLAAPAAPAPAAPAPAAPASVAAPAGASAGTHGAGACAVTQDPPAPAAAPTPAPDAAAATSLALHRVVTPPHPKPTLLQRVASSCFSGFQLLQVVIVLLVVWRVLELTPTPQDQEGSDASASASSASAGGAAHKAPAAAGAASFSRWLMSSMRRAQQLQAAQAAQQALPSIPEEPQGGDNSHAWLSRYASANSLLSPDQDVDQVSSGSGSGAGDDWCAVVNSPSGGSKGSGRDGSSHNSSFDGRRVDIVPRCAGTAAAVPAGAGGVPLLDPVCSKQPYKSRDSGSTSSSDNSSCHRPSTPDWCRKSSLPRPSSCVSLTGPEAGFHHSGLGMMPCPATPSVSAKGPGVAPGTALSDGSKGPRAARGL